MKLVLSVETHARRLADGFESSIVFLFGRRWIRFGAFYGSPPGSHIGLWRTNAFGLRGLNLRVGKRYIGPCFTLLAHTRRRPIYPLGGPE